MKTPQRTKSAVARAAQTSAPRGTPLGRAEGALAQGRSHKTAARARGEALVAEGLRLTARLNRDFWDLGKLLATMHAESTHVTLDFESFDALATERLGIKRSTAYKLMAVAEQLPRAQAVALGVDKSYKLTQFAERTPAHDTARTLAETDALIAGKRVSEMTTRELDAATAARTPKRPKTLAEVGEARADRELLREMVAHLGQVGVPKSAVKLVGDRVEVVLTRTQAARVLAHAASR